MQLQTINAVDRRNLFGIRRTGIHQYRDANDPIGQVRDSLGRICWLKVTLASGPKIEPKGVGRIGDAAYFDENRSSLRSGGEPERRLGEIRRRHVFD